MDVVKIDLNEINVIDLFESALNKKNRLDFYTDLRNVFKEKIEKLLTENGIVCTNINISSTTSVKDGKIKKYDAIKSDKEYDSNVDFDFCIRYGFDRYSLIGINYQNGAYSEMPSLLAFNKVEYFSIGNIIIPIQTKSIDIDIIPSVDIKFVGFVNDSEKSKRKPYVSLVGITFNRKSLNQLFEKYLTSTNYKLDEIKFKDVWFPILFICRKTGNLFSCSCFKGHVDWNKDLISRIQYFAFDYNPDLKKLIDSIRYLDKICHICTRTTPDYIYGSTNYHSTFLVRYMPYYYLINRRNGLYSYVIEKEDKDKAENELRKIFGHFKIGEKWVNETLLFNIVKEIFFDKKVIFHYRGKEMEGLEIDIWIPDIKIGFEYQGEQHYKPVKHWGGEESLKKQQQNDKKKKELCKLNSYRLIEFKHSDTISKEAIYESLKTYLPNDF